MLKREHIRTINRVRQLLRTWEQATSGGEYPQGKFGESCKAAEHALLNVLVIARSWIGEDRVTHEDIMMEDLEDEDALVG